MSSARRFRKECDGFVIHGWTRWIKICYGIESGDDEVLAKNKKGATCEQARKAVKWTKKAGIKVWGYFMLGLYGDTFESMQRTIDFACSLGVDIANFAVSAPYPGTEWSRIATSEMGLSADMVFDQNFSAIVEQPDCPSALVRTMQKRAYLRWFGSVRGLMMFLKNPEFFAHALADHIRSIF
jgi:anaerobic magnesium-protoporphyrin IX monomethyl ester cyclase